MADRGKTLDRLVRRVVETHDQVGASWPYFADPLTGTWLTVPLGDWCSGHWIEALRIASERAGRRDLLVEARRRVEEIRPWSAMDDMFRGHMFYYSAARLAESTGDAEMRDLALDNARFVRAMALSVNGAMPIGTQVRVASTNVGHPGRVAVDNVHPNLILDWYAYGQTGDRSHLDGACRMLDLVARDFVRSDGSTIEFIDYDEVSGQKLRHFTLLGAHDDSCWSRGQAWAIAGQLRGFEATGEMRFLEYARVLLRYWIEHTGEDLIPCWDLHFHPDSGEPLDTSAAAVVAEALARLAVRSELAAVAGDVLTYLEPLIDGLCRHVTPLNATDQRSPGRLLNGCFNRPKRYGDSHELLWGTFYLLSALHCLDTGGLPC